MSHKIYVFNLDGEVVNEISLSVGAVMAWAFPDGSYLVKNGNQRYFKMDGAGNEIFSIILGSDAHSGNVLKSGNVILVGTQIKEYSGTDGSYVKGFDAWVGCSLMSRTGIDARGMIVGGCRDQDGIGLWKPSGELVGVFFAGQVSAFVELPDIEGSVIVMKEVGSEKVHVYRAK